MSAAEDLLAVQLDGEAIPYAREYLISAPGFRTPTGRQKKWRADFRVYGEPINIGRPDLIVEIEGGIGGKSRHTTYTGFTEDCVKYAGATILGFRVMRVTTAQVNDGTALSWIRQALGMENAA